MLRDQVRPGMKVMFGRPNGEKTLAVVEKCNPSKARLRTLEGRGSRDYVGQIWSVPYSLIYPATDAPPVNLQPFNMKALAVAEIKGIIQRLIDKHGVDTVAEALPASLSQVSA